MVHLKADICCTYIKTLLESISSVADLAEQADLKKNPDKFPKRVAKSIKKVSTFVFFRIQL